jgi:protein O-GlcNAc transferase
MLGILPAEKRAQYAALNVGLGDKYRKNGAIAFAIHCYRQAVTMQDDLIQAHYRLGQALESQKDADGALQSYRKVLEIDPGHSGASERVRALAPEAKRAPQSAHLAGGAPASV